MNEFFSCLAHWTAAQSGRAHTFALAFGVMVVWGLTGPVFGFSDTWQLVINTGTTIVTFLMVFLIQNTQNRDTAAIQLKLDELIRVNKGARNKLLNLEDLSEEQLAKVKQTFSNLAAKASGLPDKLGEAARDLGEAGEDIEDARRRLAEARRGHRR
jgi:low affinity Fe/Cu permease